ncbi:MAG: methionyl-tRNA formyltransferase [Thermodesulfovibrionales bacterium]|nr:methionyl-tRNA formyltransferase [Thermodesulfovibrionales bacterium]
MRIVFFGTPEFAVPSLSMLLDSGEEVSAVVTQTDKRRGRDRLATAPPIKELALGSGIRTLQPQSIRDAEFFLELESIAPDLIVVVAYGKILPSQVLAIPPHGCINVHASLLPQYRGAAPIQWAILNGEKQTGITTMLMDEGLDTGPLLLQEETNIAADDTAETLSKRLAALGASVLMKTIGKIKEGRLVPVPQAGVPSYAPPLKKEDGRLVWKNSAEEIRDFVRGMYPWPCAYCSLNRERIKITRVAALDGFGMPGRIEKAKGEIIVGSGKGLISILELQPECRRLMTAIEFLQGRKLQEGIFFDEP